MGVSPWRTEFDLWMEKTGQIKDQVQNRFAMNRGIELEPEARAKYNQRFATKMLPARLEDKQNPVFRASFDGIDHEAKRIIEIKCPGKVDHQTALRGKVPEKYYPQVQWLLMVSGYTYCDYVSWDGVNDLVVVEVLADAEYQKTMRERATAFWERVLRKDPPDMAEQIIEQVIEDQAMEEMLQAHEDLRLQIVKLETCMEEIKDALKLKLKADKARCGQFCVQWIERIGSVDYSKIEVLKSIDLNQYRKPASRYLSIKKGK